MSITRPRHGVRDGDTAARVPVAPRVPQQRHGLARGQRTGDGAGPDGEPRTSTRVIRAALPEASQQRETQLTQHDDGHHVRPHDGMRSVSLRPLRESTAHTDTQIFVCAPVKAGGESARGCDLTRWQTGIIMTGYSCERMSTETAQPEVCSASSWDRTARAPSCHLTPLQVRQRVEQLPNGVQQRPGR